MKAINSFVALQEVPMKSGLIIKESEADHWLEGKVISVGDDVIGLKKNDIALFDTYKAIQHSVAGKKYWFLDYKTIVAIQ